MRQSEILSLQWEDVDFARSILMVMKGKNGTRRSIPLNTQVYDVLARQQTRTGTTLGPVFTTPRGHHLKARRKAGIPDFRFHDMRHTFATRLVQRGVDLYRVQRLLGHKTSLMTQRYAHHSPESLKDCLSVLDTPEGAVL